MSNQNGWVSEYHLGRTEKQNGNRFFRVSNTELGYMKNHPRIYIAGLLDPQFLTDTDHTCVYGQILHEFGQERGLSLMNVGIMAG